MLVFPVAFSLAMTEEDRHKVALKYRDDIGGDYDGMRYTSVQNMFDVKRAIDEMAKAGNNPT
eukprot:2607604-Prorocentrum_lima.AAC.1